MNFDELWDLLTTQDESVEIEAKKASQIGKSCWETISSLSNEIGLGGGYLILGIRSPQNSESGVYEIEGLSDPDKIQCDLASQCSEVFSSVIRPRINVANKQGKTVIFAFIPEAPPSEKPVYIKKQGLPRGAYRRISSTDQRCTDRDVQQLYQESKSFSYDTTPITDATIEDLEPNAINAYRQARAKINPNASELDFSDHDLLFSLNVITKHQGNYCPTIGGLILFGKAIALQRCFPLHRVDYILIEGTDWITDDKDRYQTIEIREPLLLAIPRLVINVLNDLPTRFGLAENSIQRQDIPLIPRKVIREAIVNAVMHRDYRTRNPIQIIKYSNRLEIRNPGYSLKPINRETLGEPGSVIRNEAIAEVLHETGFAETKGSGIRVMLESMLEANLSLPLFDSNRERDRFQVTLYSHNLFDDEALQWLSQFKEHNLTDEEAKILVVLKEKGVIDNAVCRLVNDIDTLKASQMLKRLRDISLIDIHGKSTATCYTLKSQFLEKTDLLNLDSNSTEKLLSGQLETSNLDSNSTEKLLSGQLETSNLDSSTSQLEQLNLELFPLVTEKSVIERIKKIGKRAKATEIKSLILELCTLKPRSSSELAYLLDRKRKYLLDEYLKPLINEGLLEYTKPENPNDPTQAYRLVEPNFDSR